MAISLDVEITTGGGGGFDRREEIFTPSVSQTVFTLASPPAVPNDTSMYVNTVKYRYGVEYTVTGSTLTWNPAAPNAFQLDSQDTVEIIYFV